jgi:hypothetical protein
VIIDRTTRIDAAEPTCCWELLARDPLMRSLRGFAAAVRGVLAQQHGADAGGAEQMPV